MDLFNFVLIFIVMVNQNCGQISSTSFEISNVLTDSYHGKECINELLVYIHEIAES